MTSMTSPSDTIRLRSRRSFRALTLATADPLTDRSWLADPDGGPDLDPYSDPYPDPGDIDVIDLTGSVARLERTTRPPRSSDELWAFSDATPLTPAAVDVSPPSRLSSIAGRTFDVAVALAGLVILAPLMIVVAVAVAIDSPGPVFYGSPRLASRGRTFTAWKFRSMRPEAEQELAELLATDPGARDEFERYLKLRNDPRLTRVGALLRQTSIDELPQLVNILLGQMSVVGPRPKMLRDAEAYGEHLDVVLSVRPGLTGLWQVSGRSRLPLAERVALDITYLQERTFRGDLVICLRTFLQLWRPGKHGAF